MTRAIEAQRQFWLADAALAATVIGRPEPGAAPVAGVIPSAGAASPFAASATGIAPAAGH
ncbi:MAG TPA: hypothetical protein VMR43_13420 [Variovorax sp.]|nr:hypothetical protein [Variovorax sp.]